MSHGYADKAQALAAMAREESVCPVCGGAMTCGKWYPQPGKRFMAMVACEQDGEFLVRVRLAEDPDGRFAPIGWSTARTARQRRATAA